MLLEIQNLHANVEGREILRGIDLKVNPGEVHAIGPDEDVERPELDVHCGQRPEIPDTEPVEREQGPKIAKDTRPGEI